MSLWKDLPVTLICVAIYLVQVTVPSLLLTLTPKQSLLRYLWMLCSSWIAYQFFLLSHGYSGSLVRYTQGGIVIFVAVLQSANLLLVNPLDRNDLIQTQLIARSDGFFASLRGAARMFSLRGLGTPWRLKKIPPQPDFLSKKRTLRWFITRQAAFLIWQWLFLDLLHMAALRQAAPSSTPPPKSTVPIPQEWASRIYVTFMGWFVVTRLLVDSTHRLASLIAVGIGRDSPDDWPPMFGSMWEAYTLRNFWGTFWHQVLRWPLTSLSNFVARDVLTLQHPSLLERYTNVFIVFFMSGLLHLTTDHMQGVSPSQSGAMRFFTGFALAFMIEDGVQELWRRIANSSNEKSAPSQAEADPGAPLWKRLVGFIWVMAWLSYTSPEYLLAFQDLPKETRWYVPRGIVSQLGMKPASIITGVSGVFLYFAFGAVV